MTRLQNAQKQLSEALADLESAVSAMSNTSETPSKIVEQNVAHVDQSTLLDEVSIIEAKLNEAIAIITKIEADTIGSRTAEFPATNERDAQ